MLDIAGQLHGWVEQDRDFAVATVVAVTGSAPRSPGAALAVDGDGTAIGSVSGGCVEGAVYDLCVQALAAGTTVLERFGYSDEDAFAVGLTCGGIIDVLVTPVTADAPGRQVWTAAFAAAARGEAAALARVARGPAELLGSPCSYGLTERTRVASAATPRSTGRRWPRPGRCWTAAAPARSASRRTVRTAPAGSPCSWSRACRRPA